MTDLIVEVDQYGEPIVDEETKQQVLSQLPEPCDCEYEEPPTWVTL